MMENIVAFDAETGTVVGAGNLVLVDLADLATHLNISIEEANERLCDEEEDATEAALTVGRPVFRE